MRCFLIVLVLLACVAGAALLLLRGGGPRDGDRDGTEVHPTSEGGAGEPALVGRRDPAQGAAAGRGSVTLAACGIVVDADDQPVPGVPVRARLDATTQVQGLLRPFAAGFGASRRETRIVAETMSAADGTFVVTGLDPDVRYALCAEAVAPRVGSRTTGTGKELHRAERTLVVVDGTPLKGRVVGAAGEGRGALISVSMNDGPLRWRRGFGRFGLVDLATAADGSFSIEALPPGRALLSARIPGEIRRSLSVEVPTDEEVVLRLYDADGAVLAGHVHDPDARPVGGAQVHVRIFRAEELGASGCTAMTAADPEGSWRLDGLSPGLLAQVHAWAPGYLPMQYRAGNRPLAPGRVEEIDLVLIPEAILEGTVRDASGSPLAGVELSRHVWETSTFRYATAVTDAEGHYELGCLPATSQLLRVRKDGYYLPLQAEGRQTGEGCAALQVVVPAAGTRTNLDIVLAPALALQGQTLREDGTPMAGVEVTADGDTGRDRYLKDLLRYAVQPVFSGADGTFTFPGLPPGLRWHLEASTRGWKGAVKLEEPLEAPATDLAIALKPTGVIEGRVLSEGGQPVSGLQVRIRPPSRSVRCAEDGTFRFEDLEAGTYELTVREGLFRALGDLKTVMLGAGETVENVVLLVPDPLPLAGQVVDAEGVPVAGARLALYRDGESTVVRANARTNAEGRFRTRVFDPGRHGVTLKGAPLGVWEAGDESIRIVLGAGVAQPLVVRILGPDDQPVAHVQVMVTQVKASSSTGSPRQVDGGYLTLTRASLGARTDLRVSNPRGADGQPLNLVPVTLENVQDVEDDELVVRLVEGRTVAGRVVDEAAAGVPGVHVSIGAGIYGHGRVAQTDAEGAFELGGIELERTEVVVHVYVQSPWLPVPALRVEPGRRDLLIELEQGAALTVRVLSPDGDPVEGAQVSVAGQRGELRWTRRGTSDGRGEFRAQGIDADAAFRVEVQPRQDSPWSRQDFSDLQLGDGLVVLRLVPGVEIRGEVVDEAGNALADVRIEAYGVGESADLPGGRVQVRGTKHFVLGPLLPGRYRLWARGSRDRAQAMWQEVVAPAEGLRFVVPAAVSATGRILGEIPKGCYVRWIARDQPWWVAPDAQGRFEVPGLRDEPGVLYVARDETSDAYCLRENVRPSDGPFEIRFEEGSRISGRVEGWGGTADAPSLQLRRGLLQIYVVPDEAGRFRFHAVPPGRYDLVFQREGRDIEIHPGIEAGRTDVVLPMPALGDPAGR